MSWAKKFVTFLTVALFVVIGLSPKVLAVTYKDMGENLDVETNRPWIIKFNIDVDESSINEANIVVLNEQGIKVPINLQLKDSKTVLVSPVSNYEEGKTYTLYVKEGVKSKKGTKIKLPAKMVFTTEVTVEKPVIPKGSIVVLDPGRAGNDVNPEIGPTGVKGKDINLYVALEAGKILKASGVQVVYTRTTDNVSWSSGESVSARSKIVNDANADILVSIHTNATSTIKSGSETKYLAGNNSSKNLASYIQNELAARTSLPNGGIVESTLKTLSSVKAAGAYVDLGYITNSGDEAILNTKEFKDNSAKAIADGVLKYLSEKGNVSIKSISNQTITLSKGQAYTLPTTVEAVMSDNSKSQVAVKWEKTSVDTSKEGTYTYKGTVEGYNGVVNLIVVIKPAAKYKVALDAGHGGSDPGAKGPNGTLEKDITLQVTFKLGDILKKNGIEVVYTRTNDTDSWLNDKMTELKTRVDIANKAKVDYFISIHANSVDNSTVSGVETLYYGGSTKGAILAQNIQDEIIDELGFRNRKIKDRSGLYVLKYTDAPSALVELEFISNPEKEKILRNPVYQQRYAEAIARGIMKTLRK